MIPSYAAALALLRMYATRAIRVARAVFTVCRRHVPAWLGVVLTVCLVIPGPIDELLIVVVILVLAAVKPAARADIRSALHAT